MYAIPYDSTYCEDSICFWNLLGGGVIEGSLGYHNGCTLYLFFPPKRRHDDCCEFAEYPPVFPANPWILGICPPKMKKMYRRKVKTVSESAFKMSKSVGWSVIVLDFSYFTLFPGFLGIYI